HIVDAASHPEFMQRLTRFEQAVDPILDGHSHYRRAELVEACRDYLAAEQIAPDDASIQNFLKFDALRRLMDNNEHNAWSRMNYGRILLLKGEYRKAAQLLDIALRQHFARYTYFRQLSNDPNASKDQRKKAEENADSTLAFHRQTLIAMAEAYTLLDRGETALELMRQGLSLHGDNLEYREALKDLEKAVNENADTP
ncbi:MAG: hypothetical protein ACOC2L_03215, partial [Candidatus Sumerlaeota bacterium]